MSNYTILIICEGEKTEPLFFTAIKDHIIEQQNDEQSLKIQLTVAPEPRIEEKRKKKTVKHKGKRKARTSKPIESIDKIEIIKGTPPLRWVKTAIRELKSGAFDEVWTVFDDDNHPAQAEAFEAAKEIFNGKTINIAFSSRSFEQYLLTHFEKSNNKFLKTDCKHKKGNNSYSNYCGTNTNPLLDCNGKSCINGYAATKNYWKNSKENNSKCSNTFLLIKDKLEIGFKNSSWLRFKDEKPNSPIYQKNPYTDVDILVKKLTNNDNLYSWINHDTEYDFEGFSVIYNSNKNTLCIKNTSKITKIIKKDILTIYMTNKSHSIGKRCVLNLEKQTILELKEYIASADYFKVSLDKHIILFEK